MEGYATGAMTAEASYFDMGGYAAYVWPAWLAPLLILGALWIASAGAYRRSEREAERLGAERRRQRRGDDA